MIRANKLTQLEGPPKMLANLRANKKRRIWRKWRFWRNFAKAVDEMIRANKLTQLEGPRNVGEFGENGDFGKISPRLLTI